MRRNSSTVIVLASPVRAEVLTRIGRSMNVTLVPPAEPADADDVVATAAAALRQAARAASPYALVAADPLAAVADGWRSMRDVSRPQGPAGFEQEAAKGEVGLAGGPVRAAGLLPGDGHECRCWSAR